MRPGAGHRRPLSGQRDRRQVQRLCCRRRSAPRGGLGARGRWRGAAGIGIAHEALTGWLVEHGSRPDDDQQEDRRAQAVAQFGIVPEYAEQMVDAYDTRQRAAAVKSVEDLTKKRSAAQALPEIVKRWGDTRYYGDALDAYDTLQKQRQAPGTGDPTAKTGRTQPRLVNSPDPPSTIGPIIQATGAVHPPFILRVDTAIIYRCGPGFPNVPLLLNSQRTPRTTTPRTTRST